LRCHGGSANGGALQQGGGAVIDPTSFLLGMLTHDFLTRTLKRSQVTSILLGLIFLLILVDVLLRMGVFQNFQNWLLNFR
jgi:multisubunit Na+/H+ antiporter MnhB subunit